jgi:hypothetical protein
MSSLDPLPYYKWLWRDWRSNRRIQRMSWAARGLYRELLDEQWAEGSIPSTIADLADICGCPAHVMQEYWPEIAPCFQERQDGRLLNSKMENQRTETDGKRVRQADSGRKGAHAKLQNQQDTLAFAKQSPENRQQSPYSRAEHKQEQEQILVDSFPPPVPIDPEAPTHESRIRQIVETLFEYYCHAFERNPRQYSLTPARREKAEARMRERIRANLGDIAKAEMDLIRAVENLSMSEYHRTNGYIDWIEQIFRSQEEFEKRLNWTAPRGGQNGSTQQGTAQRSSPAVERQRESQRNIADAVQRRRSDGAWPNDVAVTGDEAKPDATARDAGSVSAGMGGAGGGVRHAAIPGRPVASAPPVIILPAAH